MSSTSTWDQVKTAALNARPRLFEEVLNLNYDNLPYIGHLVTKTAIDAGYVAKRSNLKGNTLLEWSRAHSIDGRGAPNHWACLAAVDIIVRDKHHPESMDDGLGYSIAYYWWTAHGPFTSLNDAVSGIPDHLCTPLVRHCLQLAIDETR